jgi:predicted ATPase
MIKFIEIKNFKSIKHKTLRPSTLNLCFGLNSMGKSTLLQSFLLLRQSFMKGLLNREGLLLSGGELINLGTGKDVFNINAGKEELLSFEIHDDNHQYKWEFDFIPESNILPGHVKKTKFVDDYLELYNFPLFSKKFQYLSAEHIGPQKLYQKSDLDVKTHESVGIRGEYAIHYLSIYGHQKIKYKNLKHKKAASDTLLHQLNAWLGEISPGTRLVIEDLKGIDSLRLGVQFETKSGYTNDFAPVNVGFGLLYVLPVVLSLLTANSGSLLMLENPESHLHPKGQSAIGKLMALAASNGVQIFCESHSDHLINGVRVAIKEGKLKNDKLMIYYFDRHPDADEHKTRITEIQISNNGELDQYPEGLLDEWDNLLTKLL